MSDRLQNQNRIAVFSMVYPKTNRLRISSRKIWLSDQTIFDLF